MAFGERRQPSHFFLTHSGSVRPVNEDSVWSDVELGLYLVCDGMGGHNAGEIASALAIKAVADWVKKKREDLPPRALLRDAINEATLTIFRQSKEERKYRGMGTTIVACYLVEQTAWIAHVGDSRAYLLRGGHLRLLTQDHTLVADLVAKGVMTLDEAERHPYRSILSRNLGDQSSIEVDITEVTLEPNDRLLLCSDGLNGYAPHSAIAQVLLGATPAKQAAGDLVDLALRGGGGDNISVIVIDPAKPIIPSTEVVRQNAAGFFSRNKDGLLARLIADINKTPLAKKIDSATLQGQIRDFVSALNHDMEMGGGAQTWKCAHTLANRWIQQLPVADFRPIWRHISSLCRTHVAELSKVEAGLALHVSASLLRSLTIAEMAIARLLGEKIRSFEDDLATLHSRELPHPTFAFHPPQAKVNSNKGNTTVQDARPTLERIRTQATTWLRSSSAEKAAQEWLDLVAQYLVAPDSFAGASDIVGRHLVERNVHLEHVLGQLLLGLGQASRAHLQAMRQAPDLSAGLVLLAADVYSQIARDMVNLLQQRFEDSQHDRRTAAEKTEDMRTQVFRREARIADLERRVLGKTRA